MGGGCENDHVLHCVSLLQATLHPVIPLLLTRPAATRPQARATACGTPLCIGKQASWGTYGGHIPVHIHIPPSWKATGCIPVPPGLSSPSMSVSMLIAITLTKSSPLSVFQ